MSIAKRLLPGIFGAVGCVATQGAALAQDAAQPILVQESRDELNSRRAIYRMADCLREGLPDETNSLMSRNVTHSAYIASLLFSPKGQRCVSAAGGLKADLVMGALFRSAYLESSGSSLTPSDLPAKAAAYEDTNGRNDQVDYLRFADCLVDKELAGSHQLLAARPGSADEKRALQTVEAAAGGCLSSLDDRSVPLADMSAALAQVLYRRTRGESFAPIPDPAGAPLRQPEVTCETDRPDVCVVEPLAGLIRVMDMQNA